MGCTWGEHRAGGAVRWSADVLLVLGERSMKRGDRVITNFDFKTLVHVIGGTFHEGDVYDKFHKTGVYTTSYWMHCASWCGLQEAAFEVVDAPVTCIVCSAATFTG